MAPISSPASMSCSPSTLRPSTCSTTSEEPSHLRSDVVTSCRPPALVRGVDCRFHNHPMAWRGSMLSRCTHDPINYIISLHPSSYTSPKSAHRSISPHSLPHSLPDLLRYSVSVIPFTHALVAFYRFNSRTTSNNQTCPTSTSRPKQSSHIPTKTGAIKMSWPASPANTNS